MDGTLTSTNELIFDTFNYISMKYLNKPLTPHEITAMFGPPEDAALRKLLPDETAEQAIEDFYRYYEEHHESKAQLYPGMSDTLSKLYAQDRILALFTGKGRTTTEITLKVLGIGDYFSQVITGHDVRKHKPSGEGIRMILARFDLRPSETVMIGDSVADVKASAEAGVDAAAVLWDSYGYEKMLTLETTYRFHTLDEFHGWIDRMIRNGSAGQA